MTCNVSCLFLKLKDFQGHMLTAVRSRDLFRLWEITDNFLEINKRHSSNRRLIGNRI